MSAALASFGIQAVMGISSGITSEAQVSANNTVNEANAWASNLVRSANNQLSAARGSLSRYNQSVNNKRTLENTGSNLEVAQMNYRRARDSATQDDFESQIAFAEQAGAQAAAGALSGLSGGVVDIVNGTTALRKARLKQRSDTAMAQGDFDAAQRNKQILQAGWDSLDSSEITDNIDYGTNVAVTQTRAGNLFTDIMGGQSNQTLATLSSDASKWFKPKLGNTDAFSGGNKE